MKRHMPAMALSRRRLLSGLALAGTAALLSRGRSLAQSINTVRWVQATRQPSFDAALSYSTSRHVYESLVALKAPDFAALEPALAVSWKPRDPSTWEFQLRRDVRFHDGSPLTADDVIFSVKRYKSVSQQNRLTTLKDIDKDGPNTVVITTTRPDLSLPYWMLNGYVMSKAWAEKNGIAPTVTAGQATYADAHANGTGPFTLESFTPATWSVARNRDWWGNQQYPHNVDRVVFSDIPNPADRLAALLAGEVDFLRDLPLPDVERMQAVLSGNVGTPEQPDLVELRRALTGMQLEKGPEIFTTYVALNQVDTELRTSNVKGANPFRNRDVRKAIYLATDIAEIVGGVMKGLARPAGMLIEYPVDGFSAELDRRPAYAVAEAKKLLAAAGYPDGFQVTLSAASDGGANHHEIAPRLAEHWKKIGVNVQLNLIPGTMFNSQLAAGQLDLYLRTLSPGQTLDGLPLMTTLFGSGAQYSNPQVTKLLGEIPSEMVSYARQGKIDELWRIATEDIAYIPLHHRDAAVLVKDRLKIPSVLYPYMWLARVT